MIGRARGCVVRARGESVVASLPGARLGDGTVLVTARGERVRGEVTAVAPRTVVVTPFGDVEGVAVGDHVLADPDASRCVLGFAALGRAVGADGSALDGGAPLVGRRARIDAGAPPPQRRRAIDRLLVTGISAIDALLALGRGARVGIFGAPGAGKSTLLEAMVAHVDADATVVALVGERGREAERWISGRSARSTIVCATSDRSPAERVRAAEVAMAQAEALRAHGLDVLLVVDSLARIASALRELHVALGAAVGRGGFPPAVWARLARYVERAGTAAHGSITLLATVLSDGADEREPVSDAARSFLDGHITLSPALAAAGRFPAIDVRASASRTMHAVVDASHAADARAVRRALTVLSDTADARALGLGTLGPEALCAVREEAAIDALLRAPPRAFATTRAELARVAERLRSAATASDV